MGADGLGAELLTPGDRLSVISSSIFRGRFGLESVFSVIVVEAHPNKNSSDNEIATK